MRWSEFNEKVTAIVILNVVIVFVTLDAQNVTQSNGPMAVLSLKNVLYPIVQSNVTVKSVAMQPFLINADAEPIFLPVNPSNYHPDRVLERLEKANEEYRPYLLDFSAYILKPFMFDYLKVLADARDNGRKISKPTADPAVVSSTESPPTEESNQSQVLPINGIVSVSKPSAVTRGYGNFGNGNQPFVYESAQAPHFEGLHRVPQYYQYENLNGKSGFNGYQDRPYVAPFHLNVGETQQPRAEQLIRPIHVEPMVQFERPNINAAPVGYSFYDEMRHRTHAPNFNEHAATTPATPLTGEYIPVKVSPTPKPLIHKFAYVPASLPPVPITTKTSDTSAQKLTTESNSAETTTRQTNEPDSNSYTYEITTNDEPYDTTTDRNGQQYTNGAEVDGVDAENANVDNDGNDDDDDDDDDDGDDDETSSRFYHARYTHPPKDNPEDPSYFKGFTAHESDFGLPKESDDKPHFKGFTSQSNEPKSTRTSKFKPSSQSRSQYTRFNSEKASGRLVSTTEKPSRKSKFSPRHRNTTPKTSADYDDESQDQSDDTSDDDGYTFEEFKTFSDNFGPTPTKNFNKFSQVKVLRQDRTTTERPSLQYRGHESEKRFRPASSKYSAVTEIAPAKKNSEKKSHRNNVKKSSKPKTNEKLSRGSVKYLYDQELYHPEESRVVSTVYTENGKMVKQDIDQSPSYAQYRYSQGYQFPHRQQLNAITSTYSPYDDEPVASPTNNPFLYASQPLIDFNGAAEVERFQSLNSNKARRPATTVRPVAQHPDERRYFQDIFTAQLSPLDLEFGHVMENPDGWEERYERKNMATHRHQGKVRWGDKDGGFGEHYYDLNHHKAGDDNQSWGSLTR